MEKPRVHRHTFRSMNQKKTYEFDVSWWWIIPATFFVGVLLFGNARYTDVGPQKALKDDQKWNQLISDIKMKAERYNGDVGIYLKDLKSGRVFEYRTDQTFVCASLIKLPVMIATFE